MKKYTKAQFKRAQKIEIVFTLACLVSTGYLVMMLVFLKL